MFEAITYWKKGCCVSWMVNETKRQESGVFCVSCFGKDYVYDLP